MKNWIKVIHQVWIHHSHINWKILIKENWKVIKEERMSHQFKLQVIIIINCIRILE